MMIRGSYDSFDQGDPLYDHEGNGRCMFQDGKPKGCTVRAHETWCREHPEPWLIRTHLLDGYVETVFDGRTEISGYESYWVQAGRRQLVDTYHVSPVDVHSWAVKVVLRRWVAHPSFPNPPTTSSAVPGEVLRHPPLTSALFVGKPSEPLFADSVLIERPPAVMNSLRFRLMRALSRKPCTWYDLQDRLACEENRALRTIELAWNHDLLMRTDGKTRFDPPIFELSKKGKALVKADRLSLCDQGVDDWQEDVWVAGWQPWHRYSCPLCGAGVTVRQTARRNILMRCGRADDPFMASVNCPGKWRGILDGERLIFEAAELARVKVEITHWLPQTEVFVSNGDPECDPIAKTTLARALSSEELRLKLRKYAVFA